MAGSPDGRRAAGPAEIASKGQGQRDGCWGRPPKAIRESQTQGQAGDGYARARTSGV